MSVWSIVLHQMNKERGIKLLMIVIAVVVIGDVIGIIGPQLYNMKSEYATAEVIRETDKFVTDHPKQWPHSWSELGGEDYSQYTDFRFDLTWDMIVHNRELIYTAIQPKCHQYRTYPHAREHLGQLYEKLAKEPDHP